MGWTVSFISKRWHFQHHFDSDTLKGHISSVLPEYLRQLICFVVILWYYPVVMFCSLPSMDSLFLYLKLKNVGCELQTWPCEVLSVWDQNSPQPKKSSKKRYGWPANETDGLRGWENFRQTGWRICWLRTKKM